MIQKIDFSELRTYEFFLPGIPESKQSVRGSISRHRKNGFHNCPITNKVMPHKKGDIIITKNGKGNIDGYVVYYPDSKKEKIKKGYEQEFKKSMDSFEGKILTEEAHILELIYVYPFLSSHSQKKRGEMMRGERSNFKTTRPDLVDNLKKLVFDAMNDIVIKDDGIIASESGVVKVFGKDPGIWIRIAGK